jgi:hypothetical protein
MPVNMVNVVLIELKMIEPENFAPCTEPWRQILA